MNRLLLISIISLFIFNLTNAQDQLPTERKVSMGQNGKIYINKDLGIYLWLSTSPEEGSVKHRLLSDSTIRYTNPMYFDTEGYNTLRSPSAVDTNTKRTVFPLRDIIFEVYADGRAPVSDLKIMYGTTRYLQSKRYYSGSIKAILKSKDAISGTDYSYYSIDSKTFVEFNDTLSFSKDGEYTVKYYSVDKVGNREQVEEKTFIVDNSAPISEYEVVGVINEKISSSKAKIKLTSKDNLIGVKTIYYKINKGKTLVYSTPIPVKWLGSDNGVITLWAVDHINNKEEKKILGGKDIALSAN